MHAGMVERMVEDTRLRDVMEAGIIFRWWGWVYILKTDNEDTVYRYIYHHHGPGGRFACHGA